MTSHNYNNVLPFLPQYFSTEALLNAWHHTCTIIIVQCVLIMLNRDRMIKLSVCSETIPTSRNWNEQKRHKRKLTLTCLFGQTSSVNQLNRIIKCSSVCLFVIIKWDQQTKNKFHFTYSYLSHRIGDPNLEGAWRLPESTFKKDLFI